MRSEPHLVHVSSSRRLRVYEHRGYEILAGAVPHPEDVPGEYPDISFKRQKEMTWETLDPSLTYTFQRRCETIDEAIELGLRLACERIDEVEGPEP